jgi:hypothetical protein
VTEEKLIQKHEFMGLDCYIAAAVITGIVGVAGSVASGVSSSNAANAQTNAANQAANLQEQQFNTTQQEQAPYRAAGTGALNTITGDQATNTGFAAPFNFQADPGYQFQLQQGQQAINNSASATGGVLNGGTLKALDQYTTGLANTTYGDAYNRYLANSNQQYSQLMGVASLGENATQSTANAGATAANNAGNYLTQAGNATAAGDIGVGNSVNSGLSSLGLLGLAGYANQQSASSYNPANNPPPASTYGVNSSGYYNGPNG